MVEKEAPRRPVDRVIDLETLKALSHPLRVEILDALAIHGPATASDLASRLGESSGATSYHLRQLAKHGLVQEIGGKGTARERWWERTPGRLALEEERFAESPALREAARSLSRQWQRSRTGLLEEFLARGDELPVQWREVAQISHAGLRLTAAQTAALGAELEAVVLRYVESYREQHGPGVRPVQAQYNVFPVVSAGEEP